MQAEAADATEATEATESVPLTDGQMYERLIGAILDQRLPPGTRLVEDRLASAFGVSRTRVRPVLVRLASEQVVTLVPNRAAIVARPSEQEAREVFEARRLIEPRLLDLFIARSTPADMAGLKRFIVDEEAARLAGDMRRAIRLAGDFHLEIARGSGHQTLGRVLRELISRTSLALMSYSPAHAQARADATACGCREHRGLLAAIRLRDAGESRRRMVEHLLQLEAQLDFSVQDTRAPDLVDLFGAPAR